MSGLNIKFKEYGGRGRDETSPDESGRVKDESRRVKTSPDQTRPEQTRPEQNRTEKNNRTEQTRPDQTRCDVNMVW